MDYSGKYWINKNYDRAQYGPIYGHEIARDMMIKIDEA